MNLPHISSEPFRVVIAGGGVAALEAALALSDCAGRRVATTLLTSEEDFAYHRMATGEPFVSGAAMRCPIAEIAGEIGAEVYVGELASVDAAAHTVQTDAGGVLRYDALVVG